MYPSHTNVDLYRLIRQDDKKAFDELFSRLYPSLTTFSLRLVGDRLEAEEIAQHVFVQFWLRRKELRPDTNPPTYLFRAARNRVIDLSRHFKVRVEAEAELSNHQIPSSNAVEEAIRLKEAQKCYKHALSLLPERSREVFLLSRVGGMTYRDIATALDISYKTVEAHIARALRQLRQILLSNDNTLTLLIILISTIASH